MIYSPSQTRDYLQCPMYWLLSRQGWIPKTYNKGNLYAIRGQAVAAGIHAYHTGLDIADEVVMCANAEWDRYKIGEREWQDFKTQPLSLDELIDQACALATAYTEANLPFGVNKSEYTFEKHGNARADIIGVLNNKLIPVDVKCKDEPNSTYYAYTTKEEYRNDWQMLHYCHALSEELNTPVLEYGIVLLWYGKKVRVEYAPFLIKPRRLALWLESAQRVWDAMEAGYVYESSLHRTIYGPCGFKKACLEHNYDQELIALDYLKKVAA